MATALIVLAIGSIVAGYVGVPHALGGHNDLGAWLDAGVRTSHRMAAGQRELTAPARCAGLRDRAEREPVEAAHEAPASTPSARAHADGRVDR